MKTDEKSGIKRIPVTLPDELYEFVRHESMEQYISASAYLKKLVLQAMRNKSIEEHRRNK